MKWLALVTSVSFILCFIDAKERDKYIAECHLLTEIAGPYSKLQNAFLNVFHEKGSASLLEYRSVVDKINSNFTRLLDFHLDSYNCPLWKDKDQFDSVWATLVYASAMENFIGYHRGFAEHDKLVEACTILHSNHGLERYVLSNRLAHVKTGTPRILEEGLASVGFNASLSCIRALAIDALRYCAVTFIHNMGLAYCDNHVSQKDMEELSSSL